MSLRDRLLEILPSLLPDREEDAIKGTELISRVRQVLGDRYSDRSLRSQFSIIAFDPDSCLARIPNGQGYYLRREDAAAPSLHCLFEDGEDASREGGDPLHKALALAVRLYDTAGLGVFLYPVEEEESWGHPDLVAVQWPVGHWEEGGAYVMDEEEPGSEKPREACCRAVCLGFADSVESCRRAFYRALACGLWAQESELLLLPGLEDADALDELGQLAARHGVGVQLLALDDEKLLELPGADALFRADAREARDWLATLPRTVLALPRRRAPQPPGPMPDVEAVRAWVVSCLGKGRVEAYERRVAVI